MNPYIRLLKRLMEREADCEGKSKDPRFNVCREYLWGKADTYKSIGEELERLLSFVPPPDPEDEEATELEPEEVTVDAERGKS